MQSIATPKIYFESNSKMVMSYNEYEKFIVRLQDLMVGKTVLSVSESKITSEGSLCEITMSDGARFSICGNDIGCWIKKHPNAKDNRYKSLDDFAEDYWDYIYNKKITELDGFKGFPQLKLQDGVLFCTAPDEKVFEIQVSSLLQYEQEFIDFCDCTSFYDLSDAFCSGEMWRCVLSVCGFQDGDFIAGMFKPDSIEEFDSMSELMEKAQDLYTQGAFVLPVFRNKTWSGGYSLTCKPCSDNQKVVLLMPKNGPENYFMKDILK